MKGAIAYALSSPERLPLQQLLPDFSGGGALTFQKPDFKKFPCLDLAYQAAETGETMPAVLNAANEKAVQAFLKRQITFNGIQEVVRSTMETHKAIGNPSLDDIIDADRWAREEAQEIIKQMKL